MDDQNDFRNADVVLQMDEHRLSFVKNLVEVPGEVFVLKALSNNSSMDVWADGVTKEDSCRVKRRPCKNDNAE